jgi:hypothetical protein
MRGGRRLAWAAAGLLAACGGAGREARPAPQPADTARAALSAAADSACAARAAEGDADADILVSATVRARELRHAETPRASVSFPGAGARDTVRCTVRTNLPRPVQPGRTYRDVTVKVLVRTSFDTAAVTPPGDSAARRPPR